MPRTYFLLFVSLAASGLACGAAGCNSGNVRGTPTDSRSGEAKSSEAGGDTGVVCLGGTDKDGDGYGLGCAAGDDCNDSDRNTHPGAKELCDGKDNNCDGTSDEGVKNACGTCDPLCSALGAQPFPLDPGQDPGVKQADGVGLDPNGDLILDKTKVDFNFMWIANTNDFSRGTVSKINTTTIKEVARYFSVTCFSKSGATGCTDMHGKPIDKTAKHYPSRTAVDFNFDVWVANRAFDGQPSATKIANSPANCIDRNKNGKIDTSSDRDNDGKITTDCNGDGQPDNGSVTCTVGALANGPPEFYGDDDECVLWTVNYGGTNELGRSICLAPTIEQGPSAAWVATHQRATNNQYYRIDGKTGSLGQPVALPAGHNPYGCTVDANGILWSSFYGGTLVAINTLNPTQVSPLITPTNLPAPGFYGISLDSKNHIWLGSYTSGYLWRYKPDRASFAALAAGTWTAIKQPNSIPITHGRGVAADNRGWIWMAITDGYIWRVSQNIGDGLHDLSADTNYWKSPGSGTIGVGIDFKGNVWAIDYNTSLAGRMDLDAKGDPVATAPPMTDAKHQVAVGTNPYTYSDFTGFGLKNFTKPQGLYLYEFDPCKGLKATWSRVDWKATTPLKTTVAVRVRSGDGQGNYGAWFGPYTQSPAVLGKSATTPLVENPARVLQIELILKSQDQNTTPIVHDLSASYSCTQSPG